MRADLVPVLNIAAYRFAALERPATWVDALRGRALEAGLKGTIIVATEGINLFLAGVPDDVEAFLSWLATDPRFVDENGEPAFSTLHVRRSWSDRPPFGRLRVRHRPEVVTMRRPAIRPAARRAPAVSPERLAGWLARGRDDDGRPLLLLDTRNAFEVALGTFDGARHLGLARFEAFPHAVDALCDELGAASQDRTVVTFCTGGIRCEKAALYMAGRGVEHVLQLDGGILDYFERVGDAHWRGHCFVFDDRVALDAALQSVVPVSDR